MTGFFLLLSFLSSFVCGRVRQEFKSDSGLRSTWKFLYSSPEKTLEDYKESNDSITVITNMIIRVLGANANFVNDFQLELIDPVPYTPPIKPSFGGFWNSPISTTLDATELDYNTTSNKIILRGSSTIALATAFNWYLNEYCNTTYDWRTYELNLPLKLPKPSFERRVKVVPLVYYENVCTFGYTMMSWQWADWQTHIDWMAMMGINFPIAFVGQEYIFAKTFAVFNFSQEDLEPFFSGPAFSPWQRMGNERGWGGPLPEDIIVDQYNLQLQILSRMKAFSMTPALTAFSGKVPYAIQTLYPESDVTPSPRWAGFPDEYCCVLVLNFSDPLFVEIGSKFIELQTQYYGTSHVYQTDTFNEESPASHDATYLQDASKYVYKAMQAGDSDAVWLMQGWLFESSWWTQSDIENYLSGVNNDEMIILDLFSEESPIYSKTQSYYGKPFVWNTLHDFGGSDGLMGNLPSISSGIPDALTFTDTTVMGVGITMEGIWQNYIVYDLTLHMAFANESVNTTKYANKYSYRRYGLPHSILSNDETIKSKVTAVLNNAWETLRSSVYSVSSHGIPKSLIESYPTLTYTNGHSDMLEYVKYSSMMIGHEQPKVNGFLYDPIYIQEVWRDFVSVGNLLSNVSKFRYDLVDVTRQAIANTFQEHYYNYTSYYNSNLTNSVNNEGKILLELISDFESILNTDKHWMLGWTWLRYAYNISYGTNNSNLWIFNAKNQITLWGPTGQINDYASKQWGGLVSTYYYKRWKIFIDMINTDMENGVPFNSNDYFNAVYNEVESVWDINYTQVFPTEAIGDSINISCNLYIKWNVFGDTSCNTL